MKLKHVVFTATAAALLTAGGAQAASLSWQYEATTTRNAVFGTVAFDASCGCTLQPDYSVVGAGGALSGPASGAVGTEVSLGNLLISGESHVLFTYRGSDASFPDSVTLTIPPPQTLSISGPHKSAVGTTVSELVTAAGVVPFAFQGNTGQYAVNGNAPWNGLGANTKAYDQSIALIGTDLTVDGKFYQYVLGYNDSYPGATADWNDMVVGINAVPEPEVYAMLAAGLGLMGFVARRRKQQS